VKIYPYKDKKDKKDKNEKVALISNPTYGKKLQIASYMTDN
jgi:hypothetical protein